MSIRAVAIALLAAVALAAATAESRQRALLIGVADVPNAELPGIDLDIDNMKKIAAVMGFTPADVKVLFNSQATYANVKQALNTWVRAGVGPEDHVLIYFSGHGTRVPDPDSAGGVDDALVLHDVERVRVQGRATLKNVLLGHELGAALAAIPSRNVLVLVDACHSGSATRELSLGNQRLGVGTGVMKFFSYPEMPSAPAGATRGFKVASGSENYAALSAARDDEFAVGTEQGGLFTLGVVDAIDGAARAGKNPSVAELRTDATAFIAAHTDEQSRHHPVADGNQQLIKGALQLLPLKDGQGPTWQALAALVKQGTPLTVSGSGSDLKVGQEVTLEVAVPREGYLNVVSVDSEDRATVLYPNKYTASNEVKAGAFRFPTPDMDFIVRASEPLGPSLVVAFLTDKKVNLLELGVEGRDAAGRMQQTFTEVSARATRALSVEARNTGFAAGSMTVNVRGAATH
ncbi:MAG: caspase family protein [Gammaproteobacteria bacterium]|nr:caspase family protein [Gammaproteobacteria bacterium]